MDDGTEEKDEAGGVSWRDDENEEEEDSGAMGTSCQQPHWRGQGKESTVLVLGWRKAAA